MSFKRILALVLTVLLTICLTGCHTGYQKVNGQWAWVTWNEGQGTKVYPVDLDESTFEKISYDYAKDCRRVYLQEFEVVGANPKTFRLLEHPYSTDGQTIFCGSLPMNVVDVKNFRVIRTYGSSFSPVSKRNLDKRYGGGFDHIDFRKHPMFLIGDAEAHDGIQAYKGPVERSKHWRSRKPQRQRPCR